MRKPYTNADEYGLSKAGKTLPRVITMGGDHTITLPLLRSINKAYGPVTVIHFDSHLYGHTSIPMPILHANYPVTPGNPRSLADPPAKSPPSTTGPTSTMPPWKAS